MSTELFSSPFYWLFLIVAGLAAYGLGVLLRDRNKK
jgi:hypothetical protein